MFYLYQWQKSILHPNRFLTHPVYVQSTGIYRTVFFISEVKNMCRITLQNPRVVKDTGYFIWLAQGDYCHPLIPKLLFTHPMATPSELLASSEI